MCDTDETPTMAHPLAPVDDETRAEDETAVADGGTDGFDVEATLDRLGLVTDADDGDDLRLVSHFRTTWREQVAVVRTSDDGPTDLGPDVAGIHDVDPDDLAVEADGDGFVARVDGRELDRWPSRAALLADVTGANALRRRQPDAWGALAVGQRRRLLAGLRVLLEECPACDGRVVLDAPDGAGPAGATVRCAGCGDRLFEPDA